MSEDHIEDYLKAGKAVIAAKKLAEKLVKPGNFFLDYLTFPLLKN